MKYNYEKIIRVCSKTSVLLLSVALLGCDYDSYKGDGIFIDHGLSAASRFELNLGAIEKENVIFRIARLPKEKYTFGLELTNTIDSVSFCDGLPISNIITMKLSTLNGDVIIEEHANLNEWTWSVKRDTCKFKAFGYRQGKLEVLKLREGLTTSQNIGIKAHQGWGSYFTANPSTEYILQVTVAELIPKTVIVKIKARGGGWK